MAGWECRPVAAVPGRSQCHQVAFGARADCGLQVTCWHQVDLGTEDGLQFSLDPSQPEQADVRRQVDEQVHVTVGPVLTAGPWRPLYRKVGDRFVIAAVGPEAKPDATPTSRLDYSRASVKPKSCPGRTPRSRSCHFHQLSPPVRRYLPHPYMERTFTAVRAALPVSRGSEIGAVVLFLPQELPPTATALLRELLAEHLGAAGITANGTAVRPVIERAFPRTLLGLLRRAPG